MMPNLKKKNETDDNVEEKDKGRENDDQIKENYDKTKFEDVEDTTEAKGIFVTLQACFI